MKPAADAKHIPTLGQLYIERARLRMTIGQYENARSDLARSYRISHRLHPETAAFARLESSNLEYLQGIFQSSIRILKRTRSLIRRLRSEKLTFMFWRYQGNAYRVKGDYRTALACYRRLAKLSAGRNDPGEEAALENLIGLAYQGMGDYAEAARHVKQAYRLYLKIGNIPGQGNTLGNIGFIYTFGGKPRQAIPYFQKAIRLLEQAQVKNQVVNPLMNWGTALFNLERYDEALQKWQQAMEINQSLGDIASVAMLHNNIGQLYTIKKEFKKSLEHLRRSLKLKMELKLTGYLPSTHNAFARVYLEMYKAAGRRDHYLLALKHAARGRSIAWSLNITKDIRSADEVLEELKKEQKKK